MPWPAGLRPSPTFWGGIGGMVPVAVVLVTAEGEPLMSYVAAWGESYKLIGYLIKLFGLFAIGYIWVRLNAETNDLKAFQLGIAAPAIITGMIASYDAKDKPVRTGAVPASTFALIGPAQAGPQAPPPIVTAVLFKDIVGGILNESVVEDLPLDKLPSLFGGAERRAASDRLIRLYPEHKAEVVAAVIGAVQPESGAAYRVNIYVARTLGLIPGGWEGSAAQRAAIEELRSRPSYRDATFKENVERAIANWKPAAS